MGGHQSKTAIVSGGSSGIGLASVIHLLSAGYKVGFFGQNPDHVEAARAKISARFSSQCFVAQTLDIVDKQALRSFFEQVSFSLGQPEVLVCCAGISPKGPQGHALSLTEVSLNEWDNVIGVNLTGAMLCCQFVLPFMKDRKFGRIVFISSIAGRTLPLIAGSAYAASKAGLSGLARSLVRQYSGFGITVNIVAPGHITTPMTGDKDHPSSQAALTRIPAGRPGTVDDVTNAIGFLILDESSFINGAILDVNGGEFAPL